MGPEVLSPGGKAWNGPGTGGGRRGPGCGRSDGPAGSGVQSGRAGQGRGAGGPEGRVPSVWRRVVRAAPLLRASWAAVGGTRGPGWPDCVPWDGRGWGACFASWLILCLFPIFLIAALMEACSDHQGGRALAHGQHGGGGCMTLSAQRSSWHPQGPPSQTSAWCPRRSVGPTGPAVPVNGAGLGVHPSPPPAPCVPRPWPSRQPSGEGGRGSIQPVSSVFVPQPDQRPCWG